MINIATSYSTLDADALLTQVVSQYAIDTPATCQFWTRGVNDTYKVRCANATYSLRVYRHQLRELAHIEFEVAALLYLKEQGASVAYPIEKRSGEYITSINAPEGIRYAILTTYAEGDTLNFKDASNARQFGESVATIHQLSDGFTTSFERPKLELDFLLEESVAIVGPYLEPHHVDPDLVEQVLSDLRAAVTSVPNDQLDTGFCHGDFHGGNAHNHNGVLTHFDFDCCGLGYRVFDLATFNWSLRLRGQEKESWDPFLEGYRSVRDISDTDLSLIDPFVIIRHIWLMALHMGNARDFGHKLTSDSYIEHQLEFIQKQLEKDEAQDDS